MSRTLSSPFAFPGRLGGIGSGVDRTAAKQHGEPLDPEPAG